MRIRLIAALMTMVLMVTVFAGCYTYDEVIEDPVESSTSQKVTSSKPAASTSSNATSATSSKKVVVSNKPTTNNQNNGNTSKREVYSYPTIERKVLYPSGWVSKYVIMEKPSEDPTTSDEYPPDEGTSLFDDYTNFASFGDQIIESLSKLIWNGDYQYGTIAGEGAPSGGTTLWPYGSYMEACGAAVEFDPTNTTYMKEYQKNLKNVMRFSATNVNQKYGVPADTYLAMNCVTNSINAEVYYDDDVWIAKEFLHAYKIGVTSDGDKDVNYLTLATRMIKYICETGWDETWKGGGLLWMDYNKYPTDKTSRDKNSCINAPASDAAVDLYMITGDEAYLDHAKKIYGWVRGQLMDPSDHLMMDKFMYKDGKIETDGGKLAYNTGCMISAAAGLYEAEKKNGAADAVDYLEDAKAFAEAGINAFIPRTYATDRSGNYTWTNHISGSGDQNAWFVTYMAEGIVDLHELAENDPGALDAEQYTQALRTAMGYACSNRAYTADGWFRTQFGDMRPPRVKEDITVMGQSATARMLFMLANVYEK